ncbi:aldo/keto reductase [Clostridioides difficile]|nr:aldo/keto reductase [Clostridioides difficile]
MLNIKLNNGVEMPIEGFGVYQMTEQKQCEQAVLDAIKSGYRSIDTATAYYNEEAVGTAIKKYGIPRDELFITTKLWIQDAGYENAKKAFQTSLDKLGLDYLDLYLIHQPYGDYYGSWRAMEELYMAGRIRAIGVCNFDADQLTDLIIHNEIVPAINQVECHPFFHQKKLLETMKEHNIKMEAWGPLAQGSCDIWDNEVLKDIAQKHKKSIAQIVLRWHIQRNVIIIPKSIHKERMEKNLQIFDFELSKEDMLNIDELDTGASTIYNKHEPEFVKTICSLKVR